MLFSQRRPAKHLKSSQRVGGGLRRRMSICVGTETVTHHQGSRQPKINHRVGPTLGFSSGASTAPRRTGPRDVPVGREPPFPATSVRSRGAARGSAGREPRRSPRPAVAAAVHGSSPATGGPPTRSPATAAGSMRRSARGPGRGRTVAARRADRGGRCPTRTWSGRPRMRSASIIVNLRRRRAGGQS